MAPKSGMRLLLEFCEQAVTELEALQLGRRHRPLGVTGEADQARHLEGGDAPAAVLDELLLGGVLVAREELDERGRDLDQALVRDADDRHELDRRWVESCASISCGAT